MMFIWNVISMIDLVMPWNNRCIGVSIFCIKEYGPVQKGGKFNSEKISFSCFS